MANNNKIVKGNSNRANKIFVDLFKSNKLKNNKSKKLIYISNIRVMRKIIFLILNVKEFFNCLKQAIIKALIF